MSESRNIRSYLSVREAMADSEDIRQNAEIAVQAKQAELTALCEGGNLYVQGECGECDKAAADVQGAPMDAYPPEDQAFYRFWYAHMVGDLMQPPLTGIKHATARYIWDAARAAPGVAAAPASWKLVPVELTQAMREAWDTAPNGENDDENMRAGYRAMLAAAPSPAGVEGTPK